MSPMSAYLLTGLISHHRLESSRAQRLLVLLEELNLPYEFKTYKRDANSLAPEELKNIHPLGKSPSVEIEIPGQAPFVLAESAAIFEYLCDNFGKHLIPGRVAPGNEGIAGAESEEFRRYRYFMHYSEGSLMSLLAIAAVMSSKYPKIASQVSPYRFTFGASLTTLDIKNAPVPFFVKPITRMITSRMDEVFLHPSFQTHFHFLEGQLKTSPDGGSYLCGSDITAADFLMIFPVEFSKSMAGLTSEKFPKLCAYLDKIKERESYKAAERKVIEIEGSFKPVF
jgi:glutathione S-transferase